MPIPEGHKFPAFSDFLKAKHRERIPQLFSSDLSEPRLSATDIDEIVDAYAVYRKSAPGIYLMHTWSNETLREYHVSEQHFLSLHLACCYAYFHSSDGCLREEDIALNVQVVERQITSAGFSNETREEVEYCVRSLLQKEVTTSTPEELRHIVELFLDYNTLIEIGVRGSPGEYFSTDINPPLWILTKKDWVDNEQFGVEFTHSKIWIPWAQNLLSRKRLYLTTEFSPAEETSQELLQRFIDTPRWRKDR